jgi:elongation factor P
MYMADTTAIKKGAVIQHNNDLFVVSDFQFVNPGKGAAFTKTKMKSITTGKSLEITYKSGENVDVVEVERKNAQFLYANGDVLSFMVLDTYETIEMNEDVVGDEAKYLKEGLTVIVAFFEGNPVAVDLPRKISYSVKVAPPAVKGDSASGNVTKDIELENGLIVQAPIFIKEGEHILVNVDDGAYAGRDTNA